jgi:hypothetical protein
MKSDKNKKGAGDAKRGVRLNKTRDVKRLLSRLINEAIRKEIDTDLLRAVTYACTNILKSFETGELEERLNRIEEKYRLCALKNGLKR